MPTIVTSMPVPAENSVTITVYATIAIGNPRIRYPVSTPSRRTSFDMAQR